MYKLASSGPLGNKYVNDRKFIYFMWVIFHNGCVLKIIM